MESNRIFKENVSSAETHHPVNLCTRLKCQCFATYFLVCRSILWTGEEQGKWGSQAYATEHKANEKEEFNFFIESDIGTFEPRGLDFNGNSEAECIFKEILKLMSPINATEFATPIDGGPDIDVWTTRGFPGASLLNKNEKYFWFHHSAGDSMLLEDTKNLDKSVALFAATAFVIADLSIDMPKDLA